jgi:adenylate kinase
MRIILLGAPGAGKGSQAVMLAERLNIPHISTGDIFRDNMRKHTELGKKAKGYMDKGQLVPDDLTVEIVKDRLLLKDCEKGFILDGFPRTLPQAEYLENAVNEMDIKIDYVIDIHAPDETIIKRLAGRRICSNCGNNYHTKSHPPAIAGICDECGGTVVLRNDDKEDTVLKRLEAYHEQTEPLIEYYESREKLLKIDGTGSIEDTYTALLNALGIQG